EVAADGDGRDAEHLPEVGHADEVVRAHELDDPRPPALGVHAATLPTCGFACRRNLTSENEGVRSPRWSRGSRGAPSWPVGRRWAWPRSASQWPGTRSGPRRTRSPSGTCSAAATARG